ncbi:MAG: rhodanese-like domain-containing protein [Deltaproteobacteria bacterium]|nr:rhodanese-like domain-containing protein [Deltaproteobacteria bacterium]
MSFKDITPHQAHDLLKADTTAIYIDVRTPREFDNGHPAGAVNIPVAFPDPARGMVLNPDFVSVVAKNFPKDKKLVLGCQAGGRSARAAGLLAEAGYQDLSNMLGGFGGMRDQTGRLIAAGWEESGLPVSKDNGEGVSYASLSAKDR